MSSVRKLQCVLRIPHRYISLSIINGCKANRRRLRNFGIVAHIDAGKTTTTECILNRTGMISRRGSVDRGDTVTDFTKEERERGISIVAAAVADIPWKSHHLNLIDTPGHVDFSLEVERSLRVMDGTILVLDASKGVQAQTRTVWRQASRYRLPAIAYANKMDRTSSANIQFNAESVRTKLGAQPVAIHFPFTDSQKRFAGFVDLVKLQTQLVDGTTKDGVPERMREQVNVAREGLIGQLADMDDDFAEIVINSEKMEDIANPSIIAALRRCTITRRAVPLLCGSSKVDVGVDSLLDAAVEFLPSPLDQHAPFLNTYTTERLCCMAFKTIYDKHQGILTFVRIYSGQINLGKKLYNVTQSRIEQPIRLLRPTADYYEKVESASLGDIVILSGLKHTRSGDVFLDSKADLEVLEGLRADVSPVNQSLTIPPPILFGSIEAPSLMAVKQLEIALECIVREDPSISVTYNPETNQTVLAGMGDLHLEVTVQRIRSQFGVDAKLGTMAISYRELLTAVPGGKENRMTHEATVRSDSDFTSVRLEASIHLQESEKEELVTFEYKNSEEMNWSSVPPQWLKAIESGCRRGLSMAGPLLNSALCGVHLKFYNIHTSGLRIPNALQGAIMSCASEVLQNLVKECETVVMEPMMSVEVGVVSEESLLAVVLGDLSRRRGRIRGVDEKHEAGLADNLQTVSATVPMSALVGYASDLRRLTSGRADLHMELESYEPMDATEQQTLLEKLRYW